MRYLILPDVHNQHEQAERLIESLGGGVDRIAFLGDYFDSYHDTPAMAAGTAEWLRWSICQPRRIHLMGNHDLPYRWGDYTCRCPGYTREKHRAISGGPMSRAYWQRIDLVHVIRAEAALRPIVLSHAGFTLANLYGVSAARDVARGGRCAHLRQLTASDHLRHIQEQAELCSMLADRHAGVEGSQLHHWFNRGSRVGERNVGGPFWLDLQDLRSPLPGVDQVVGHTHVTLPSRRCVPNKAATTAEVWGIDTALRHAAIIDTDAENGRGGMLITPVTA